MTGRVTGPDPFPADGSMTESHRFHVNGRAVEVAAAPASRLTRVLREHLGLTGTKVGCDAGDCGTCTVLLDGEQVCACLVPLGQVRGRSVTTVEGLAGNGGLSRLQRAFHEHGAAQCGICTPGMLMAASTLLGRLRPPSEPEVLDALGGVLCRCTGYRKIVRAVLAAVDGTTGDAVDGATGDAVDGATGDAADGAIGGATGDATGDVTTAPADAESESHRRPGAHDQRSVPRDTGSDGGSIPDPGPGSTVARERVSGGVPESTSLRPGSDPQETDSAPLADGEQPSSWTSCDLRARNADPPPPAVDGRAGTNPGAQDADVKRYVGCRLPSVDGPGKVTGRAVFGADGAPAGALRLRVVRSPHAYARFTLGDCAALHERHPGLARILTAADVPGVNGFGIYPEVKDQPVLAPGIVRYRGEAMFALVGDADTLARLTDDRLPIQWEPLPAVSDPRDALAVGAPPVNPDRPDNVLARGRVHAGEVPPPGGGPPGRGSPGKGLPNDGSPGSALPGGGSSPGSRPPGDGSPDAGPQSEGSLNSDSPGGGSPGSGSPDAGSPGSGPPSGGSSLSSDAPGGDSPGNGPPDDGGGSMGNGPPGDGSPGSGSPDDDPPGRASPAVSPSAGGLLVGGPPASGDLIEASGEFETPFIEHAYIEPEAGWARRIEGGRIEVTACTQTPYMDRDEVANVLGIAPGQVRIRPSACGGGFGGKLDQSVQPLVALAAWLLDKPVCCTYTRPESMAATTKRHPSRIRARAVAEPGGRLLGYEFDGDFDTGAYASWGPTVAGRVPVHCMGPYRVPNVRAEARAIFTHSPPAGAFRGFGVPQAAIAHETLIDELAVACGIDPLEFRRRNALQAGDRTATGQVLEASAGLVACLDALRPRWEALRREADAFNASASAAVSAPTSVSASIPIADSAATSMPASTPTADSVATSMPASTPTADSTATSMPASTPTADSAPTSMPVSTPTADSAPTSMPASTPTADSASTSMPASTPIADSVATSMSASTPASVSAASASVSASTPAAASTTTATAAGPRRPHRRHGVGIACMWYGCGNTSMSNPSSMRVTLSRDGQVVFYNGAQDVGQGSSTVMLQIMAEALGLPIEQIDMVVSDTDLTEDAGKSSASRQTFVSGRAAQRAGADLRAKALALVNAGPDASLRLDGRELRITGGNGVEHTVALGRLPAVEGEDVVLEGRGVFDPPTTPLDENGQGIPYATYGFAAQIASVEVDPELGTVALRRIVAAHDVGAAVNPTLVEGQIEGGIAQGIGLALMEEYVPGRTENLHDYLFPSIGDVPEIECLLVEDPEPLGPYGAKGIGEPALIPTAPAILNAVHHATGVRLRRLPILPHRVRAALEAGGRHG